MGGSRCGAGHPAALAEERENLLSALAVAAVAAQGRDSPAEGESPVGGIEKSLARGLRVERVGFAVIVIENDRDAGHASSLSEEVALGLGGALIAWGKDDDRLRATVNAGQEPLELTQRRCGTRAVWMGENEQSRSLGRTRQATCRGPFGRSAGRFAWSSRENEKTGHAGANDGKPGGQD